MENNKKTHSEIMKALWAEGKIKPPPKKARVCVYCGCEFYWKDSKNHRKTCSDSCANNYKKNIWKINKHPKGMIGKTHTDDNKIKMGERSKKMWEDPKSKLNSEQAKIMRAEIASRNHETGVFGGVNSYSRCKRGWYDYNGKKYYMRSKWELNYACYLNFLVKQKEIKDWEYEADIFRFNGIKQGVVSYKPDFKVFNNDSSIEYHEVKGWMDSKSKTKIKRMAKYYPEIKLLIIGASEYKALAKNKSLFKGWE